MNRLHLSHTMDSEEILFSKSFMKSLVLWLLRNLHSIHSYLDQNHLILGLSAKQVSRLQCLRDSSVDILEEQGLQILPVYLKDLYCLLLEIEIDLKDRNVNLILDTEEKSTSHEEFVNVFNTLFTKAERWFECAEEKI